MASFAGPAQLSFQWLWNLIFQFTPSLHSTAYADWAAVHDCVQAASEKCSSGAMLLRRRPFASPSIQGPGGDCLRHNHAGTG
jgi:hypothetical protein